MGVKISKNNFYQTLFVLCVFAPYFNNYELTFLTWLFTAIITVQKKYSALFSIQIFCFGSIFSIALFSSIFSDFKTYDFIRDITYLMKPILGLLIGYQLCKSKLQNPLKTLVLAGGFLAIYHLILVVYTVTIIRVGNMHDLRFYSGYFSDFEIYTLVFLIFSKELKIEISLKLKSYLILALTVSSFFYLSRTNLIQFFVLYVALLGYLVINRNTIIVLTSLLLTIGLLYSAILYYNPKRNGAGMEAFLYKIKNAPIEPFKTKINKEDYRDFNDNYRSVESILTIRQSANIGSFKIIFGQGLGSQVDLQRDVELDGHMLRYISILHNGFMTVFLKSGLLGVILLLISVFSLRIYKVKTSQDKYLKYILTGTLFFLLMSYWVFMGLYFKADTKSIIVGLVIALIENRNRENVSKPLQVD